MFYSFSCFFFFNDTATTEIYTLSLHDALPIYGAPDSARESDNLIASIAKRGNAMQRAFDTGTIVLGKRTQDRKSTRLNSSHSQISYAVFCLKKKKKKK